MIEKDKIPKNIKGVLVKLDKIFRETPDEKLSFASGGTKDHVKNLFLKFRSDIIKQHKDKIIFPVGINYLGEVGFSIFDRYIKKEIESPDDKALEIFDFIKGLYEYIYIPKEIDPDSFTQLATKEMQVLMGETLHQVIKDLIPSHIFDSINKNLANFVKEIENELGDYTYRTPTNRQQNLRKNNIYKLIIEDFFNTRKLHRKNNNNFIEINSLSSGEKQKAIIDVAYGLLKNHREDGLNLIIGIDEPENSLHTSACFEQFNAIYEISKHCRQLIFSSHWYGFLPVLSEGDVCVISKDVDIHNFDLINLGNYREQVEILSSNSKGILPHDMGLKSITDFVQSVITSITSQTPYNWLICEGSTEKIYFDFYFRNEIKTRNLRIIPVGGCKKIKKIYQTITIFYNEIKDTSPNKDKNWGKILLLSDTDSELLEYSTNQLDKLKCQRIINDEKQKRTIMVDINAKKKSPETEIEDCLDGKAFIKTLEFFKDEYPELTNIHIQPLLLGNKNSFFTLNLRNSEKEILKSFLDHNKGDGKVQFAKKYIEIVSEENYAVPEWIIELQNWFNE